MHENSLATSTTIKLTNEMADAGANAVLVVNPCYNKSKMVEDVLYEHFIKVIVYVLTF